MSLLNQKSNAGAARFSTCFVDEKSSASLFVSKFCGQNSLVRKGRLACRPAGPFVRPCWSAKKILCFWHALQIIKLLYTLVKVTFFSEDIMVLIRSPNFGTKSLSTNFFNVANFELYYSLFEFCLQIDQKV